MKTTFLTAVRVSLLSLTVLICFSSFAQTKKVSFNTSPVVPSAEGSVKVKKDKNDNYNIDISIDNLAEPKRLTPPRSAYVVWLETAEKGVKNIGQIHSSSSMFSKARKASIETVSSNKPVRIFVTAEDDGAVEKPDSTVVLTTNSF